MPHYWRQAYRGDHQISWAPDAKRIIFDARWEGVPTIFTISVGGGQPKRINSDRKPDFQPYWSPDGRKIAFASNRAGNQDVWVMDVK
jgi:Tol biopolymer transport system component